MIRVAWTERDTLLLQTEHALFAVMRAQFDNQLRREGGDEHGPGTFEKGEADGERVADEKPSTVFREEDDEDDEDEQRT